MSIVSNALLSEQEVIIRESARRVATEVVGSTAAERAATQRRKAFVELQRAAILRAPGGPRR